MNPRMTPPRAPTPKDQHQQGMMASLGHDMDMADNPQNASEAHEDIQSQAMAMGSKTASQDHWLDLVMGREKAATSAWRTPQGMRAIMNGKLVGRAGPDSTFAARQVPQTKGNDAFVQQLFKKFGSDYFLTKLAQSRFGALRAMRQAFAAKNPISGKIKGTAKMPEGMDPAKYKAGTKYMINNHETRLNTGNEMGAGLKGGEYSRGTRTAVVSDASPNPMGSYRHERMHGMIDAAGRNPELASGLPMTGRWAAKLMGSTQPGQKSLKRDAGMFFNELTAHTAAKTSTLGKTMEALKFLRKAPGYARQMETGTGKFAMKALPATAALGTVGTAGGTAALALGGGSDIPKQASDPLSDPLGFRTRLMEELALGAALNSGFGKEAGMTVAELAVALPALGAAAGAGKGIARGQSTDSINRDAMVGGGAGLGASAGGIAALMGRGVRRSASKGDLAFGALGALAGGAAGGFGLNRLLGKSAALSMTADEGGEDAPALQGSPMRGWQWKVLQKDQAAAQKAWMPRVFKNDATPLTELLASSGKQGLLGGLAGGALGGAAGTALGEYGDVGMPSWQTGLIGGGLGALLGGVKAYSNRRYQNDLVTDALRRTPPGATVKDYKDVQDADAAEARAKKKAPNLPVGTAKEARWLAPWLIGAAELTGLGAGMAGMPVYDMHKNPPAKVAKMPARPAAGPPPTPKPKVPMRIPGKGKLPMLIGAGALGLGALGLSKSASQDSDGKHAADLDFPAMPSQGVSGETLTGAGMTAGGLGAAGLGTAAHYGGKGFDNVVRQQAPIVPDLGGRLSKFRQLLAAAKTPAQKMTSYVGGGHDLVGGRVSPGTTGLDVAAKVHTAPMLKPMFGDAWATGKKEHFEAFGKGPLAAQSQIVKELHGDKVDKFITPRFKDRYDQAKAAIPRSAGKEWWNNADVKGAVQPKFDAVDASKAKVLEGARRSGGGASGAFINDAYRTVRQNDPRLFAEMRLAGVKTPQDMHKLPPEMQNKIVKLFAEKSDIGQRTSREFAAVWRPAMQKFPAQAAKAEQAANVVYGLNKWLPRIAKGGRGAAIGGGLMAAAGVGTMLHGNASANAAQTQYATSLRDKMQALASARNGLPAKMASANDPSVLGTPTGSMPKPIARKPMMKPTAIKPMGNPTPMGAVAATPDKVASYDDLTPFARGFFTRCDEMGIPHHHAIEKVGADFGEEAYHELIDGLEKTARGWLSTQAGKGVEFGRGLFGFGSKAAPKYTPSASGAAAKGLPKTVPIGGAPVAGSAHAYGAMGNQALGYTARNMPKQVLPTAFGALGGGFAGNDLGMGGEQWEGPLGMKLNVRGMEAGAAAANPFLRRRATRNLGGAASVPMAMARTSAIGSMGGSGLDGLMGAANLNQKPIIDPATGQQAVDEFGKPMTETRNTFGQLGAYAGLGLGGLSQGGRLARMAPGAPAWVQNAGRNMGMAEKGMKNFAFGQFQPIISAATYLPRKAINYVAGKQVVNPNFYGSTWDKATKMWNPAHASAAGRAGRLAGVSTIGLGATGMAYSMAENKMRGMVDDNVARVYGQAMPQIREDLQGMGHEFLDEHGMIGEDGQFDPMIANKKRGGILGGFGGGADGIFKSLGMNPASMSPLQKLMILGGAGMGGGGLLAASPALAGMGGVTAAAGLLPQFMPNQGQQRMQASMGMGGPQAGYNPGGQTAQAVNTPQPGQPGARNEWLHQQQGT